MRPTGVGGADRRLDNACIPARRQLLFGSALLCAFHVNALTAMNLPEITLTGAQVRAMATALAEFDKTGQALDRFEVIVASHADSFEVIFVPEADSGRSARGGSTAAGRETHYWIGRTDYRLERTTYAR